MSARKEISAQQLAETLSKTDPKALMAAMGSIGGKKKSKAKRKAILKNLLKAHKARGYKKPISKKILDGAHQSA